MTLGDVEVAIALPRDPMLFDGAVLLMEYDRVIGLRIDDSDRLPVSVGNPDVKALALSASAVPACMVVAAQSRP